MTENDSFQHSIRNIRISGRAYQGLSAKIGAEPGRNFIEPRRINSLISWGWN